MADIEKGLPVRTEDDPDQYVRVKLADPTSPTQFTTVDADGNAHVEVHGNRADDAADVALELSEEGKPNGRGDYQVDDNSEPNSSGVVAGVRSASNLSTDQTEHITSIEDSGGTVRALDLSLHDEDGEAYTSANPLPVTIDSTDGTAVHDFNTAAAVVSDATSNHDLSVANGDTFLLQQVIMSASGRHKAELQIGDGGAVEVFATLAVKFGSEATHSAEIILAQPKEVVGTVNTTTVRVIRTNRDDDDAQDLYSTIIGVTL